MPLIWIYAPNRCISVGLTLLVTQLGFRTQLEPEPQPDMAIWNMVGQDSVFPPAPPMPTLALLPSDRMEDRLAVMRLGYRGYIDPEDDAPTFKRAIEAVWRGDVWASRKVLAEAVTGAVEVRLTPRESQVMSLLLLGYSNLEIAERLGAAEKTVKVHVSSILQKYGARNRLDLVVRRNEMN